MSDRHTEPAADKDPGSASQRGAPGSLARHWTGVIKPGRADDYLSHLRRETLPALRQIDGFVTASVLCREVDDGIEFRVITVWRSLSAIEAFAGADVNAAVVPSAAQALMVRWDERAVHYEIVS
jgi:heme-degrading monooxygenase HmoA